MQTKNPSDWVLLLHEYTVGVWGYHTDDLSLCKSFLFSGGNTNDEALRFLICIFNTHRFQYQHWPACHWCQSESWWIYPATESSPFIRGQNCWGGATAQPKKVKTVGAESRPVFCLVTELFYRICLSWLSFQKRMWETNYNRSHSLLTCWNSTGKTLQSCVRA